MTLLVCPGGLQALVAVESQAAKATKEVEDKVQMVESLTDKLNAAKAKILANEAALKSMQATAAADMKQSVQVCVQRNKRHLTINILFSAIFKKSLILALICFLHA